jgi:hypothetical protein
MKTKLKENIWSGIAKEPNLGDGRNNERLSP